MQSARTIRGFRVGGTASDCDFAETMEICLAGINFRTASLEDREHFSLNRDEVASLLHTIRIEGIADEVVLLSTCNRTEIYYVCTGEQDPLPHILSHVSQTKQVPLKSSETILYRYRGREAVTQLFRVACSLDSQMVGEHEVLG